MLLPNILVWSHRLSLVLLCPFLCHALKLIVEVVGPQVPVSGCHLKRRVPENAAQPV